MQNFLSYELNFMQRKNLIFIIYIYKYTFGNQMKNSNFPQENNLKPLLNSIIIGMKNVYII